MSKLRIITLLTTLALLTACGAPEPPPMPPPSDMKITSPVFADGAEIPLVYSCEGQDISPPLEWSGAPEGTQSFALLVDDPDAPRGTFTHWIIFNIPPDSMGLWAEAPDELELSDGTRQGKNSSGGIGYRGPCPPPGSPHRYYFTLFALDRTLDLPAGAGKSELLAVIHGHVLAQAQIMGTYQR